MKCVSILLAALAALSFSAPTAFAAGKNKGGGSGKPGGNQVVSGKPPGGVKGKQNNNKPSAATLENEFEDLLRRCDKNKDDAITREEYLANPPNGKDADAQKTWFTKKDTNKDGKLLRQEFVPQKK